MSELDRLMTSDARREDSDIETSLRPHTLADYIGQEQTKKNLKIAIEAALTRHDALDHILLYGPPGLGKTTLACIIASEMGQNIRITSGPAIDRPTSPRGTCCLSTKSTACPGPWRKCCTPPWRTTPWTS